MTSGSSKSTVFKGCMFALAGGLCWGFSGTCAELLMGTYGLEAVWISCMRMLCAGLLYLAIALAKSRDKLFGMLRDKRSLVDVLAFAILGVAFTQVSYLLAISYCGAGVALLLQQCGVGFIMIWTCARARKLPHMREVIGLVLAFVGVYVISTQGETLSLNIPLEGLVWGIIAAITIMFYTLIPERIIGKWGSVPATGVAMIVGGILLSALVQPWTYDVQLQPGSLAALAAIILFGTFGAYYLYLQGVKHAGPMKASLIATIEPVSAMVISAVWLGSPITVFDVMGGAAILCMVFLVSTRKQD